MDPDEPELLPSEPNEFFGRGEEDEMGFASNSTLPSMAMIPEKVEPEATLVFTPTAFSSPKAESGKEDHAEEGVTNGTGEPAPAAIDLTAAEEDPLYRPPRPPRVVAPPADRRDELDEECSASDDGHASAPPAVLPETRPPLPVEEHDAHSRGRAVTVMPAASGSSFFSKTEYFEVVTRDDGTQQSVIRQYKDFALLHTRLAECYPYRIVPTLPEKSFMGFGEDENVPERRRAGLEVFLRFVVSHPVLSHAVVLDTFLTVEESAQFYSLVSAGKGPLKKYREMDTHPHRDDAMTFLGSNVKEQMLLVDQGLDNVVEFTGSALRALQRKVARIEHEIQEVLEFNQSLKNVTQRSDPETVSGRVLWWAVTTGEASAELERYRAATNRTIRDYGERLVGLRRVCDGFAAALKNRAVLARALQSHLEEHKQRSTVDGQQLLERHRREHAFAVFCLLQEWRLLIALREDMLSYTMRGFMGLPTYAETVRASWSEPVVS